MGLDFDESWVDYNTLAVTSAQPASCGNLQQTVGKGICCRSKEAEAVQGDMILVITFFVVAILHVAPKIA